MKEIISDISSKPTGKTATGVFFAGLLLSILTAIVEILTGKLLLVSFFYIFPIAAVCIYSGRKGGIFLSIISSAFYIVTGALTEGWFSEPISNIIVPPVVFILTAIVISHRDTKENRAVDETASPISHSLNGSEHVDLTFQNFFDNAKDAIYSTDEKGKLNIANKAFFEITGYSPEELNKLNYKNLVSPAHRKKIDTFYKRQLLKRTQNTYVEFPIVTKSGEERWVAQSTFAMQVNGSVKEFYFITRDISEHVRDKEVVRSSEQKLRQIIDLVPHFIFAKNEDGKFILANKATADVYGITVEELLTKTDADFAKSKEEAEGFRKDDLEVIKSGKAKFIAEEKITDTEGNVRYLQTIKIPYKEPGTDNPAVLGVATDITERKHFIEALKDTETNFRNFAKTAPVALTRYDVTKQCYEFVNDEFVRQSGYTLDEFEALSDEALKEMLYEADRERVYDSFKRWKEHGYSGVQHLDYRIINKEGKVIWLDTFYYSDFDPEGNLKYINQICVDVTERKQMEDTLRNSEERYKAFIDHSTEGIYSIEFDNPISTDLSPEEITDEIYEQGYIGECNEAMAKMYGYSKSSDLVRKKLTELHGAEDIEGNKISFRSFIENDYKINNGETTEVDKNGNLKYFYNNAVGIISGGKLTRIWGTQVDITERKQITDQNRKLYQAVEQSSASIIITSVTGEIEYVNHKFTEITGYLRKEVIGKVARIFKKGTVEGFSDNKELVDLIHSGESWSGEYLNRRKDGEDYWEYATISPIKNEEGIVTHFVAISEDITDQKLTEDSIRRSEERYRAFITHSSEGIYRMELRKPINVKASLEEHIEHFTKYAYLAECNDVMAKMYGYETADEVVDKPVIEILGQNKSQNSNTISFESFVKAGYRINNSETREVDKEGHAKYFLNNGLGIIEDEYLVRIWGTQRDITELRQVQEQLRKLSRAVEQSADSVIIMNTEGKIEYVNPKFTEVTGFTFEEVMGRYPYILYKGEVPEKLYNEIRNCLEKGLDWKGEYYNKRKNGERYWEYATISPIKDENGNVTHFLYVKEDITERKTFENELMAAKERAEEASQAKSQFLANMSHEIRTPMNGIVGMAQLLTLTDLNEEQSEYVDMIHYSSDVLLKIINDILDFSKIEAGKFKLSEEEFNLRESLDTMFRLLKSEADSKNLKFVYKNPKHLDINVFGDKYRLNQILTNLVSNAIKFTREGEIKIVANEIKRTDDKVKLEFVISDTGIGIPSDKFDNLFESFTQLENPYVKQYMGTGLGLSIVKRLIEIMNGEIEVESEEQKGSVFTVRLEFKLMK